MTWRVSCQECDHSDELEEEEAAVGWMFGHVMSSGHNDIEKEELDR